MFSEFKAFVILSFEKLERGAGRRRDMSDEPCPFQEENMPFESKEEFLRFDAHLADKDYKLAAVPHMFIPNLPYFFA